MIGDKIDALLSLLYVSGKVHSKIEEHKSGNGQQVEPAFQGNMGEAAYYQDLLIERDEADLDDLDYIDDLICEDDGDYMDGLEAMDDFISDQEDDHLF